LTDTEVLIGVYGQVLGDQCEETASKPTFDHFHVSRNKGLKGRNREEGIEEGAHIGIHVCRVSCVLKRRVRGKIRCEKKETMGVKAAERVGGRKGVVEADLAITGS
jgi:hypothetical protein